MVLRDIIFEQNLCLLTKIANDKFNHPEDKQDFINKYHKKNFTYMKVDKKEKDTISTTSEMSTCFKIDFIFWTENYCSTASRME